MARRKTSIKKKARPPFDLKRYLVGVLRKASYRYPSRYETLKASRTFNGKYKCATCQGSFPREMVQIDHKSPIVSITGWTSWDDYIAKMFVGTEGLQTLCKPCHREKTLFENKERRRLRK